MRDPTEDLLREVVTGDRAESDAEVQRALRDHPGLRTRLDRLRALSAQLDAAGALQRAILGAPEDEASARLPAIDIGAVGRRRRVRRWWLVVAALALGALGGVAWWSSRDGAAAGTEHDLPLGTGEWELT